MLLILLTTRDSLQLILNELFLSLNNNQLLLQLLDFSSIQLSFLLLLCFCFITHEPTGRIHPMVSCPQVILRLMISIRRVEDLLVWLSIHCSGFGGLRFRSTTHEEWLGHVVVKRIELIAHLLHLALCKLRVGLLRLLFIIGIV